MDRNLLVIAAQALKITPEEAEKHCRPAPEIDGYYLWNPTRGGLALLINRQGEKLAATSSVSYERHVKVFQEGRRN